MSDDLKRMEEGLERHLNEARSGLADTSTLPELRTTRRRTEELPKMDEIAAQDADMAEKASGGMRVRRRGNSGSRAAKRPRTAGRSGQKKQSGVAKRTGASKRKTVSKRTRKAAGENPVLKTLDSIVHRDKKQKDRNSAKKAAAKKKTAKKPVLSGIKDLDLFGKKTGGSKKRPAGSRAERVQKLRRLLMLLAGVAAVLIIVLAATVIHKHGSKTRSKQGGASSETPAEGMTGVPGNEVLHLSFPRLRMAANAADAEPNEMTVTEFNNLLTDLYGRGYVLVDIRDLSAKDEDGTFRISDVQVPQGKTPLVISQHGLSYGTDDAKKGYATGIELTEEGVLTNLYLDANGGTRTASCDVITCVDDFIREHPDFAVNDARGVIALTGEGSVLGYTDGSSAECQNVINKMFEEGWLFASGTSGDISYGAEMSMFEADVNLWQDTFTEAIGPTDIILLPDGADIGNRSPYTTENQKYSILSEKGFCYYCIDDPSGMTWMQAGTGFVRQSMHEVNSYEQYLALMDNGIEAFVKTRSTEISAAEAAAAEKADAEENSSGNGTSENGTSGDGSSATGADSSNSGTSGNTQDGSGTDSQNADAQTNTSTYNSNNGSGNAYGESNSSYGGTEDTYGGSESTYNESESTYSENNSTDQEDSDYSENNYEEAGDEYDEEGNLQVEHESSI